MGFWDNVVGFRESLLKDRPTSSNEAALNATKYIRSILEPNWNEQDSARHHLTSRFRVAHLPYDLWLDQFARKLKAMRSIEGTEDTLRRLASLDQYASARFEMETGLALSLGGFDVRFVRADQTGPSADILADFGSREFVVEVTALNRSQNETRAMELSNWAATVSFTSGMTAGGMINGSGYSPKLMTEAKERVSAAFEMARSNHSIQEASVPSFARIWVGPNDMANQMPKGVAGMFSLTNAPERDLETRLQAKIRDKMGQISGEGLDSVLVVWSDVAGWQSLEDLIKKPASETEVVLNTIPSLMGLSFAGFGGLLRSPETEQPQSKESMTLFMSEIGFQEPYAFLNWENRYSTRPIPKGVFAAFRNYPANVKGLPMLE